MKMSDTCRCKTCNQCKINIDVGARLIRQFYDMKDDEPVHEDDALRSGNTFEWALKRESTLPLGKWTAQQKLIERKPKTLRFKRYDENNSDSI